MSVTTTYNIAGMTCGHCEMSVREEVGEIAGVQSVEASHETGLLTVTSEGPLNFDDVTAAVAEAGEYTVTPA